MTLVVELKDGDVYRLPGWEFGFSKLSNSYFLINPYGYEPVYIPVEDIKDEGIYYE